MAAQSRAMQSRARQCSAKKSNAYSGFYEPVVRVVFGSVHGSASQSIATQCIAEHGSAKQSMEKQRGIAILTSGYSELRLIRRPELAASN